MPSRVWKHLWRVPFMYLFNMLNRDWGNAEFQMFCVHSPAQRLETLSLVNFSGPGLMPTLLSPLKTFPSVHSGKKRKISNYIQLFSDESIFYIIYIYITVCLVGEKNYQITIVSFLFCLLWCCLFEGVLRQYFKT